MRKIIFTGALLGLLAMATPCIQAKKRSSSHSSISASSGGSSSIVLVFKDGHQQSFPLASIAHMEFRDSAETGSASLSAPVPFSVVTPGTPGRSSFVGEWQVGAGGGSSFFITLEENGGASSSMGAHGKWTSANGEVRIGWDDGSHDVIRKNGSKYDNLFYEPGRSLSDTPSRISEAKSAVPQPL